MHVMAFPVSVDESTHTQFIYFEKIFAVIFMFHHTLCPNPLNIYRQRVYSISFNTVMVIATIGFTLFSFSSLLLLLFFHSLTHSGASMCICLKSESSNSITMVTNRVVICVCVVYVYVLYVLGTIHICRENTGRK